MRVSNIVDQIKSRGQLVCIITLFGVLQFFLLTFLAAIFYPGGYEYFEYYFSDLGAEVARNGEVNTISSTLFFLALTINSLTLIPFWVIIQALFPESTREKLLSRLGSALGVIASPFIIGIALFPLDTHLETHFVITLIFFSLFSTAILLYSIAIRMNPRYPIYFVLPSFFIIFLGFLPFFAPFTPYGAILQKIVVYSAFLWILIPIYLVWPLIQSKPTPPV